MSLLIYLFHSIDASDNPFHGKKSCNSQLFAERLLTEN